MLIVPTGFSNLISSAKGRRDIWVLKERGGDRSLRCCSIFFGMDDWDMLGWGMWKRYDESRDLNCVLEIHTHEVICIAMRSSCA